MVIARKQCCVTTKISGLRRLPPGILLRVRTHQQSRFESNPVQSDSPRHGNDPMAYFQRPPRQCVHTSRVESHGSCRVKSLDAACSIFVSQALVIGRGGCCLAEKMDIEKLILLVKDHEAIFNASRCDHRNRDYISSIWQKIAQEMGVGKTSASMFYFLL